MLEFFRRHRTALFVVIIIVMIAFSFWGGWRRDSDYRAAALPSDTAMIIYGKDYTVAEAQQMSRSLQFSYQALQMFDLYFGLSMLGGGGPMGGNAIGNAFVLKKLLADAGIRASDAEAVEALKQLPGMQTNGQFDPLKAQDAEALASANGMTPADLLDIMRLKIGLERLRDLVGKNYEASPFAGDRSYASTQQTMKVSTLTFKTDDYKKGVEVKDDEIQKAYDEKKETFMSAEKRAVKYVLIEAPKDLDKKELKDREAAEKAVTDKINAITEVVVAKNREAKLEEVLKEADQLLKKAYDEAKKASAAPKTKETAEAQPKDNAKAKEADPKAPAAPAVILPVEKLDLKIETLTAFAQDAAPDAIKDEAALIAAIFQNAPKAQPVSEPVKTAKGTYFFSVTTIEEPKQQTLAEVKEKVKTSIIDQKAVEARTKAVNEIRDFIAAGLKDKKKIEDLVKEKKLTLTALEPIGNGIPPPAGAQNIQQITEAARTTADGQISKPVDIEGGNILVYVSAKELRKSDASAVARKSQVDNLSARERDGIFQAWFGRQLEAAAISMPQLAAQSDS